MVALPGFHACPVCGTVYRDGTYCEHEAEDIAQMIREKVDKAVEKAVDEAFEKRDW